MFDDLTKEERLNALMNAIPKPPTKYELGGDYYYKCGWLACGADINKWFDYCPKCGQKIDWEDE